MSLLRKLSASFFHSRKAPLYCVILVALIIAFQNISVQTFYSGWDNVHPEFNMAQYAKRVLFGSWLEYQGMGGAAGQGHQSELFRIPIIAAINLLFPANLNRSLFIFLMYLIGGFGMYIYLQKIWLSTYHDSYARWIACISALFYLLNIITLQQFYISFEMFTVQFAFLPFLLLSIHLISTKRSLKTILLFLIVQLLIAPSAHTPTVHYLGVLLSLIYTFFLNFHIHKRLIFAFYATIFVGLLTLLANAYWLIPNMYYLLHDSRYVIESRANQLFGMESIWAIREAATLTSILTGIHYVFTWQNYNFSLQRQDYIFGMWRDYVNTSPVLFSLVSLNLICFFGALFLLFNKKKSILKYSLLLFALFSFIAMWMGALLPSALIDGIYTIKPIQEAFRNAFTKFSILYSFLIVIFFSQALEQIVHLLKDAQSLMIKSVASKLFLLATTTLILCISWPSFTGHFINPKLKAIYPQEYFEMFTYFQTLDPHTRVLELPFYSHEGWILYDWSQDGPGNGYQGIGFQFFGIPQPLLTPDFARWTESSDFFYHELKQTLNSQDVDKMRQILTKYRIGYVIIDENAVNKYGDINNVEITRTLIQKSGLVKIWSKNYLAIYENRAISKIDNQLIVPQKVTRLFPQTDRVVWDSAYDQIGDYSMSSKEKAQVIYPFMDGAKQQVKDYFVDEDGIGLIRSIPPSNRYQITIPGYKDDVYSTVFSMNYDGGLLSVTFPKTLISTSHSSYTIPQLADISVDVKSRHPLLTVSINEQPFTIADGQNITDTITIPIGAMLSMHITEDNGPIQRVTLVDVVQPQWSEWTQDTAFNSEVGDSFIRFYTQFPNQSADLAQSPSDNCTNPALGLTDTVYNLESTSYIADHFGVNCNHYIFPFLKQNLSYIFQIKGVNVSGRSVKVFIDPNTTSTLPEEFLLPDDSFNTFINLLPLSSTSENPYSINWESRSFGRKSENAISTLAIYPTPLERLIQVYASQIADSPTINPIISAKLRSKPMPYYYVVDTTCSEGDECSFGINQSYDDLWFAFDSNLNILDHVKYNNWANLWYFQGDKTIYIVYLPGILSFVALMFLMGTIGFLTIKIALRYHSKKHHI